MSCEAYAFAMVHVHCVVPPRLPGFLETRLGLGGRAPNRVTSRTGEPWPQPQAGWSDRATLRCGA